MALANAAWLLANNEQRVLVIDWDLEAPGLHRYFHPFLEDPEMISSPGLIDYFIDVSAAARTAVRSPTEDMQEFGEDDLHVTPWWHEWTTLLRYTYSINWNGFPGPNGTLDLVPAGKQDVSYAERVAAFDWRGFYEKLGGGVLLEALKRELRHNYDYILIDSRTGVGDTSGICTVHMPDDLVVCFTMNEQSLSGAAAAAESAWAQRLKPSGEPGLRIWPVPTRIELAEREKLEAALETSRRRFDRYILHMAREQRLRYWESVQVLYQPIFAYEECLAPFVEGGRSTYSMSAATEALVAAITGRDRFRTRTIPGPPRRGIAARFSREQRFFSDSARPRVILVRGAERDVLVDSLADAIRREADVEVRDDSSLAVEDVQDAETRRLLEWATVVLAFQGEQSSSEKWRQVLAVPPYASMPLVALHSRGSRSEESWPAQSAALSFEATKENWSSIIDAIRDLHPPRAGSDPSDPERGRWGGAPRSNGRTLSASVEPVSSTWFRIRLEVRRDNDAPRLGGVVVFHLHPTLTDPVRTVQVVDGVATLEFSTSGAFTVGAEADRGATRLELDMAWDAAFADRSAASRYKTFVSYHHANDHDRGMIFKLLFDGAVDIVERGPGDWGDIDPLFPTDAVHERIRDDVLGDTGVTVVLVGTQTWQRKHVDWEIGATLRDTRKSPRGGLVGILLPSYQNANGGTLKISGEGEVTDYNPCTIPPRLHDNVKCGYATLHPWSEDPEHVRRWIHEAYIRKSRVVPDNSYPAFGKNRTGDGWC